METLYRKVEIKSEQDLPKEGNYDYVMIKNTANTNRRLTDLYYSPNQNKEYWMTYIDWYLQPIEPQEPEEVNIEDKSSIIWNKREAKQTAEEMNSIISELKKDFSGSKEYLSGVNDGMYHLFRKHLIEKVI